MPEVLRDQPAIDQLEQLWRKFRYLRCRAEGLIRDAEVIRMRAQIELYELQSADD